MLHAISVFFGLIAALFMECVLFAVVSSVFCLIPGGILVTLYFLKVIRWTVPAHGAEPEQYLSVSLLMKISWIGSFAGFVIAFASFFAADKWDFFTFPDRVRDGQAAFGLIFSGPLTGLLGSAITAFAYRLIFCVSTEELTIAPWLYSGNRRTANRVTVASVLLALLCGLFVCAFSLNCWLVHPGPW